MDEQTGGDDSDLPPPTAPTEFMITLKGYAEADHAQRIGDYVRGTIHLISRFIDLERLDGITVAFNYKRALAEIDRGYASAKPLESTDDGQLLGVAMAPTVMRNGIVKAHLVFDAAFIAALEDRDSPYFSTAVYLIAHECGHIADLKTRDEAFPETILQTRYADLEAQLLGEAVGMLWDEYAACRASALFGEGQTSVYEESVTLIFPTAREKVNEAIRRYRSHANILRLINEAGQPIFEPLRAMAYLVGHLDGLGEHDLDLVPQARDLLIDSPFQPFVTRLTSTLRALWDRRGLWVSLDEFDPLKDICRDLVAFSGILFQRRQDGSLYVGVPFTPETMP